MKGEPVNYTERDFPIWADFKDRYNADVTVITSSLAFEDCVWVFVKGDDTKDNDGAIHLTVEQATVLIDALTAWRESVDEEEE